MLREEDLWPEFGTCSQLIKLPVWPRDKSEEVFNETFTGAVEQCSIESSWTRS